MPVMKPADLWDLYDPTAHRRLDLPELRFVLRQLRVRATAVGVGEVLADEPPQAPFVDDDPAVGAFPADAADQGLEGRAGWRRGFRPCCIAGTRFLAGKVSCGLEGGNSAPRKPGAVPLAL